MKLSVNIPTKRVREIIQQIAETTLVKPSVAQLRKLFEYYIGYQMIRTDDQAGDLTVINEVLTGFGDTVQRELLMDLVAQKFGGRSWPGRYEGDKAMRQFYTRFRRNACKAGWGLLDLHEDISVWLKLSQ